MIPKENQLKRRMRTMSEYEGQSVQSKAKYARRYANEEKADPEEKESTEKKAAPGKSETDSEKGKSPEKEAPKETK